MKGLSLYSKILRNAWLIDKIEAEAYLPAVMQLLTGQEVNLYDDGTEKDYEPYAMSPFEVRRYSDLSEAPEGSIAVIAVEDVLDKDDYCGVPGTKTLTQRLESALSHDNIIGAVLVIDSPGGSPYGTQSFADAILAAEKPVVGFVEGRASSAAYWIAAACDEIILGGNIVRVGSIGTYATIRDYTKHYEEMGVKIWEIYATDSTDKNAGVRQLIEKGDATTLREKELDPINKAFMQHVSDSRKGHIDLSQENVLTGKMYTGQEAIDVGLADSIGSFMDALQAVEDRSQFKSTYSNNKHMFNSKTKLKSFLALVEKCSKGEVISAEELTAANTELEEAGVEQVQLVTTSMMQFDSKRMKTLSNTVKSAVKLVSPETNEEEAESFDLPSAIQSIQDEVGTLTTERDNLQSQLDDSATPPATPKTKGQQEFEDEEEEEPVSASEKERKSMRSLMETANEILPG